MSHKTHYVSPTEIHILSLCRQLGVKNTRRNRKLKARCERKVDYSKVDLDATALSCSNSLYSESETTCTSTIISPVEFNVPLKIRFSLHPMVNMTSLPMHSQNVAVDQESEERLSLYFQCTVVEGEFLISNEEQVDIFKDGHLQDYSVTVLRKLQSINNMCVVNFKSNRVKKHNVLLYSYCAHYGCKTFKFNIKTGLLSDIGVKVQVYSSSVPYRHEPGLKKTR